MTTRDYSLLGPDGARAVETGLAAAEWYHTDVPRKVMKDLMQRSDAPAIRDTIILYASMIAFAAGGIALWGTWWCVPFWLAYGVLYGSASDSRWHECSHGTAFKTPWMNNAVYEIASFMIMRNSATWRWSHARHHTDTLVTGRDPEFNVTLPPDFRALLLNLFALQNVPKEMGTALRHAAGHLSAEEKTYIPEMAWPSAVRSSRVWVLAWALIVGAAVATQSWLPLLLLGPLPSMAGAWLMHLLGLTQHAGLPENVLDHRLNSRTILMGPVLRFLYWNMNYHVEHHMFPLVPYHALPKLHALMKDDCPPPYTSTGQALAEILPVIWRQRRDQDFHIARPLPARA